MAKATNSISNFLSEVSTGLAKPCRFEIQIDNPPCVTNSAWGKKVSMFCDTAFFPTSRVLISRQQLFGPPSFHPVGIDYGGDSLSLNFFVDREMQVKQYFDSWIDGIVSRNKNNDASWHVTNYQKNYLSTMYISQLDESNAVTYKVKIEDVFPNTVNPLTVDNNLTNTVHKLNVTFNFRRWTAVGIGADVPPISSRSVTPNNIGIVNGTPYFIPPSVIGQNQSLQQAQNLLTKGYSTQGFDSYFFVN